MAWETDVIIIGTGAAGIGAMRGLAGSGASVVMLEALPRLGGRAWTLQAAGVALDLGCGYLHSAERNPWVAIAETAGIEVDRSDPAWNKQPARSDIHAVERVEALRAFDRWTARVHGPRPASDCAADLLDAADARWTPYLQAMSGYISGDELERISVQDYAAYDAAASNTNWRLPAGYGALVTGSLPTGAQVHFDTPVEAIKLDAPGVVVHTAKGALRARAVVVTVSTNVLSGDGIAWPAELSPWREAAADLPLGNDEKLYFEILGEGPFEEETYHPGDLSDPASGAFYIRPQGKPVVECFLGGSGARRASAEGPEAAFARAIDQLRGIFGSDVPRHLKPLIASSWTAMPEVGGGYSHALPGKAEARLALAQPFDGRVFFAGEATHRVDFSTAHGALISGLRAASEVLTALAP